MESYFQLKKGFIFKYKDIEFEIKNIIDLDTVEAKNNLNQETIYIKIKDIQNEHRKNYEKKIDFELLNISDKQWKVALKRFEIIKPLIKNQNKQISVKEVAKKNGISVDTIYRWLKMYKTTESITSLISLKPKGGKGQKRLPQNLEDIVESTIKEFYLNRQKKSIRKTHDEIKRKCHYAEIRPPHYNTIRFRINSISPKKKAIARHGHKYANSIYDPTPGNFDVALYPNHFVQIDHTKVDLDIVDDINRKPIGRPWITVAIDLYSRMVSGIYLSIDYPSEIAVGMCISNAFLPKDMYLAKYNIKDSWPCWGRIENIHSDNGPDFRSKMLERACEEYGMNAEFRVGGFPHHGGHIERLLGTFMEEIHSLPGTTFSSIEEKGDYNPDETAALTLSELEEWLLVYITGSYHQRFHNGIQMSPIKMHEKGMLEKNRIPSIPLDEKKIFLDFLPYFVRNIQQTGVVIDYIWYYSDVFRKFQNIRDPINPNRKKKYIFKRDPRDISVIYFFDDETNQYYSIPYRDSSKPPMSIWELKEHIRNIRKTGYESIDENIIFEAQTRMLEIEETAKKETKKQRKRKQQRIEHKKIEKPIPVKVSEPRDIVLEIDKKIDLSKIEPFEDIESWED